MEKAGWVGEHVCAEVAHRQFVFTIPKRLRLYFRFEGKITEDVVANMRSWKHSGFSVDQSVRLEAGDQEGVQRLIPYFLRCPFSQARMIEVTEAGKVNYGWYSNQTRGQRAQRQPTPAGTAIPARSPTAREARQGWAALIRSDFGRFHLD